MASEGSDGHAREELTLHVALRGVKGMPVRTKRRLLQVLRRMLKMYPEAASTRCVLL